MIARVKQLPTIETKRGKLMSEYSLTKTHYQLQKRERKSYLSMLKNKIRHQQLERKREEKSFLSMLKIKQRGKVISEHARHQHIWKKERGKVRFEHAQKQNRHQELKQKTPTHNKKKGGKVMSEHAHKEKHIYTH